MRTVLAADKLEQHFLCYLCESQKLRRTSNCTWRASCSDFTKFDADLLLHHSYVWYFKEILHATNLIISLQDPFTCSKRDCCSWALKLKLRLQGCWALLLRSALLCDTQQNLTFQSRVCSTSSNFGEIWYSEVRASSSLDWRSISLSGFYGTCILVTTTPSLDSNIHRKTSKPPVRQQPTLTRMIQEMNVPLPTSEATLSLWLTCRSLTC